MLKQFVGAAFAGICLMVVVFAAPATSAESPVNPYAGIYAKNVAGLKAPDQSLDGVLAPNSALAPDAFAKTGAQSKTCSQRCSTTCSKTCTTTRGCSSNCKRQTDGCGGSSGTAIPMPPVAPAAVAALPSATNPNMVFGVTHFTVGSTEADVKRVMGTPSAVIGGGWSYGYSTVSFRDGRVVGFNNIVNNLKVAMVPPAGQPSATTFAIGSSEAEVLAAQGTPTALIGNSYSYGYSSVSFANGIVSAYNNVSNNLKVR